MRIGLIKYLIKVNRVRFCISTGLLRAMRGASCARCQFEPDWPRSGPRRVLLLSKRVLVKRNGRPPPERRFGQVRDVRPEDSRQNPSSAKTTPRDRSRNPLESSSGSWFPQREKFWTVIAGFSWLLNLGDLKNLENLHSLRNALVANKPVMIVDSTKILFRSVSVLTPLSQIVSKRANLGRCVA